MSDEQLPPTPPDPSIFEDETPEPEPKKEPMATTTDIVVVLVLIVVGLGFWFWYRSASTASHDHFHKADSLYAAHQYPAALQAYRSLRDGEGLIGKKDDSLMYLRMDSLEMFESQDQRLADAARAALVSRDTILIRLAHDGLLANSHGFVPSSLVDSLKR